MTSQRTPISREIALGQPAHGGAAHGVNVGEVERLVSVAGGGALALLGLKEGSLLGLGLAAVGGALVYRGMSGHCHLYGTLGVSTAGEHNPVASIPAGEGFKLVQAVTINRSADELYRMWRDFESLPRFMSHLVSVRSAGRRSHWAAHGPVGTTVEWDAEVINEDPGRMIAWRSLEGSQVGTAGSVHFLPLGAAGGTEVTVSLKYDPPGGKLGGWLAGLFGQDPEQQIREDLRRFKRLAEAGELSQAAHARRF